MAAYVQESFCKSNLLITISQHEILGPYHSPYMLSFGAHWLGVAPRFPLHRIT